MERNLWIEGVVREFQVWAWTCWDLEKTARANALAAFRATLPTPRSALESCVLNGLLFTAAQWCEKAGRRSASESGDARRLLVNRAFAVADDNAPVCLTVDDLARALSVHPRTLNRAFQTVCGTSVGNALQQRQFETAQALVAEMKVEAAAAMMRMSRTALHRLFRSQAGCTPGTWRRTAAGQLVNDRTTEPGRRGDPALFGTPRARAAAPAAARSGSSSL